ncbi:MAG: glycosyltransferase family 2 protein [Huintestinicola sp.]|uniref:glycosyltransferase family 2 protein n=1 Tax=Huintestinicola sp. TaxID=2981661 RepID=UPI003F084339
MPLVSVIIPVYNVEKYITASVRSAMAQTLTDIEIILINDGSADRSGELCRELAEGDSRIRVIDKANGGVSSARNAGIECASGKWLYFMDPDDLIEPHTLETAVNTAEAAGTDMCFFDYDKTDGAEKTPRRTLCLGNSDKRVFTDTSLDETLKIYNFFEGSCCMFIIRADIVKGKLSFDEELSYCEDEDFKLRCYANISSFAYVPEVLYHYYVRENSLTHREMPRPDKAAMAVYRANIRALEKYTFPLGTKAMINSSLINLLAIVVYRTLDSRGGTSLGEKLEMIRSFICSEEFEGALREYDRSVLTKMSKLLVLFGKPNIPYVLAVYFLRRLRQSFGRRKNNI